MNIIIGFLLVLLTACVSCNPVRRIDMKNETADTVKFIWRLNEDSLMNNPFLLSNSKKLEFTLYPPKVKAIKMSFGEGNWSPKDVQKLVGFLESFEIISPSQHIKIDSLPMLKDFLLARRRGIGGARIEIAVMRPVLNDKDAMTH
ncbi:hypothetical protein [Flavisolibacter ginsenosidimutans]|uniref:Uncharacterized protein n=1 Tax=Flavisolibacter ginsenosidimutans TaxID=661481 RepID=A0A5B8UF73_9BACT|nr:hypothetical protein [Flavisolibacter ginsenosidimutans]QEC55123.1 hypothetical protein FSB75_04115 [Flavisolibacter ginsenosidimutans]